MLKTMLYWILIGVLNTGTCRDYQYKGRQMTFHEAQRLCELNDLDVAIASNDEEIEKMNSEISKLSEYVGDVWLGLVYTGTGRQFKWTNGKLETDGRWSTVTDDEPDQVHKQQCAVVRRRDYKWDSRQCDKKFEVVCSSKDIIESTFTLHKKNKRILNQDMDTLTSRSDIDCAVACKRHSSCSGFVMEASTRLCSMFSFDIIEDSEVSSSHGSNIWKRN